MAKHPRVYPPEFRRQVLELIRAGKSANAVALEFNISRQTLTNWLKHDEGSSGRSDGLTSGERDELGKLRKENKQLRIERDILKKPRPGSLKRPNRSHRNLQIRKSAPGRPGVRPSMGSGGDCCDNAM